MQDTKPQQPSFFHMPKFQSSNVQKPTHLFNSHRHHAQVPSFEFDGKRLRTAVTRKTVDYNSSIVKYLEMTPPVNLLDNPINAVTTKFVRACTNKIRCPVFCVAAHDSPVRCILWNHSDTWMVTGDHTGYVKYWQK